MKLVLDTNIYCDYAEGKSEVVEIIAELGENIYLPAIVIGELSFGFMKGSRQEFNETKLQEIIHQLRINIIDIDRDVARKYGIIYLYLTQQGQRIPINDVWIAACCMEIGGTLLTRDKHFSAVKQIDTVFCQ